MQLKNLSLEELLVKYPVDDVTPAKFGELVGKSTNAIEMMIKNNKLPFVEMQDPGKPNSRAEKIIYIAAYNEGLKQAFLNRPKELREAWLSWLFL